ncbi:hypothetical protein FQN55_007664 [Onygenales sp. PD_40]|nr:hypothetical protein FQN55_007664 [Onygenales sp. PD_40]KAK2770338.1 hypothetical protein FQN53_005626 [Emmonsiellopsis sp. PD_33]KAK2778544.1 hypothetical protein FQN52_002722 [Onygenales sp. PD_12]KAK2798516.1 hypothetical protein FQN51_007673 [Onygenales sp. PD_10]
MLSTNFFTLPLELRHMIYDLMIYEETPPPQPPSHVEHPGIWGPFGYPVGVSRGMNAYFQTSFENECVFWPNEPPQIPSASLLLASRQIRAEVLALLSRRKLLYKGTIHLQSEMFFRPGWTSIPAVARYVDTVEISLHITGARLFRSGFWSNGDDPSMTVRAFKYLLHDLLEYGPWLHEAYHKRSGNDGGNDEEPLSPPKPRNIKIGTLDLNIHTPAPPYPEDHHLLDHEGFRALRAGRRGVINPRTIASELAYYMEELLKLPVGNYEVAMVFSSMEELRILVDGEVVHRWHVQKAKRASLRAQREKLQRN